MLTKNSRYLMVFGLIVLAVLSRFLPHPANFSPVIGIALFAGARFSSRLLAILVPILAMAISDLYLGWHSTLPYVYVGMALVVFCGWKSLKTVNTVNLKMGLTASVAAVGFFLISNFGVWTTQNMYTHDLNGLVTCYIMALPFFPATLISALVYSIALFGLQQLAESSLRKTV